MSYFDGFVIPVPSTNKEAYRRVAAAMAPVFTHGDPMFIATLYAVCSLAAFAAHRALRAVPMVRAAAPDWKSWTSNKFPMGLALASMVVLYLLAAFLPQG